MSLPLLFRDELSGFYRSKVMIFLWAGLPLMAILLKLWSPDLQGEIPFTTFTALMIASIGGTLVSVMLAVSIVNEKGKGVYDLFLIRPIRRRDLLISKFLAVFLCVVAASIIAMSVGIGLDFMMNGSLPPMDSMIDSLVISIAIMAVASSVGVLIGVVSPSVLVGAILVIYGGAQVSSMSALPSLMGWENATLTTAVIAMAICAVFMALASIAFARKQF
jgi:ABC-type transport system involved in multi-copper enzyme maturation permease subunit